MKSAQITTDAERDQWFAQRSDLFRKITYPSVRAQTLPPTRWYLLLSAGDESLFEGHLGSVDAWIKPVFVPVGGSPTVHSSREILTDFNGATGLFISRIDNDDAIDRDFFASTVDAVVHSETLRDVFVLHKQGCRWDGDRVQSMSVPNNPFATVFSPAWRVRKPNPLGMNHSRVLEHHHLFAKPTGKPRWLQSLHGTNALNQFIGSRGPIVPSDYEELVQRFSLDPGARETILLLRKAWAKTSPGDTNG